MERTVIGLLITGICVIMISSIIFHPQTSFAQPFLSNINGKDNVPDQQNKTLDKYLMTYTDPVFSFKISYPSNLTRCEIAGHYVPTTKTGHESLEEVVLRTVGTNRTFLTFSFGREPGNIPLRDYIKEEINMLSKNVGFELIESSPTKLGGIPAYKIVYLFSIIKNGVEIQAESMEIVTIIDPWPIFVEYNTGSSDFQKYLPIAQNVINSFQFVK